MSFILPTDTCYGLAGYFQADEYTQIYALKGRDFTKQLAWLVRDYEDLGEYIDITDEQITFLRSYPRPWTILAPKRKSFVLPDFLDPVAYSSIAFRVASACIRPELRDDFTYPLFLTSANLSGQKESSILEEALRIFDGISGYDGGVCDTPSSDIFQFAENGEIEYIRRRDS